MALPGSRRRAEALHPIGLDRSRSHFLGAVAKPPKIYVKGTVTKEGAEGIDSVTKPLKQVVELRAADYFAIGTQKCRGHEANGHAQEFRCRVLGVRFRDLMKLVPAQVPGAVDGRAGRARALALSRTIRRLCTGLD